MAGTELTRNKRKSGSSGSDFFGQIGDQGAADNLNWRIKIPIIKNAIYLRELGILFGGSVLVFAVIIFIIFAVSPPYGVDYVSAAAQVVLIGAGIGLGLLLISFLILNLVCWGGLDTGFHIGKGGVTYKILDKRYKRMNRLTFLISLMGKSNAALITTGAALVAISKESGFIKWSEVRSITVHRKERVIFFRRKGLINPIPVFCLPENFDTAVALVEKYAQGIKINVK